MANLNINVPRIGDIFISYIFISWASISILSAISLSNDKFNALYHIYHTVISHLMKKVGD